MLYKKGYSVVEVLLAGSILALAIAGIVGALLLAQRNNQANIAQSQALEMAKEGIEALKSIRDRNYSLLVNTTTPVGITFSSGVWNIINNPTPTQDRLDKPTRTRRITIADSIIPNAKTVTVTVTYQINPEGKTATITLTETLANILTPKATGVTAESANYRLADDKFGEGSSSLKDTTP